MRDIDQIEADIIEGWKEHFNGIETYQQTLLYLSFLFIGFGLGGGYAIHDIILLNPHFLLGNEALAIETQQVTRKVFVTASVGFLLCHITSFCLGFWFGDN